MTLTVDEAFRKFKTRLELKPAEQQNATKRHTEVREFIRSKFAIENEFLTGSYKRYTKTKPLKDIDVFFVHKDADKAYRDKKASLILDDYEKALVEHYGKDAITRQGRSINIDFGVPVDQDERTNYQVLSIDAVPAFAAGENYEIPDDKSGKWIRTNPKIHEEKATQAHAAYSDEWKGIVRMLKYWNNHHEKDGDKPVKPSFLLEVMAMDCLYGGWGGSFDREFQALFATLADRIGDTWPDPAGLGPAISEAMTPDRVARARAELTEAARQAGLAIHLRRQGRHGEALKAWKNLFGPMFPLS